MPARMIPTMWAAMRTLAFILQLVGVLGVIVAGTITLTEITESISEEAKGNE